MKRIRFNPSIFVIALVISLVISLLSLTALFSTPAKAAPPRAYPCMYLLNVTTCKLGCVLADPNGCGPGQWSYYCARRYLYIYVTGQKVGGYYPPAYYCDTTTTCWSTCD